MKKNLLLSFLLCAMINLQASDRPLDHRPHVVAFCKTAGLSQDQVDAIAARFRLKNYRNNTVEDIHAHLPDQYKSITKTQIRCFLYKVYFDAVFMKELYPSRIILPDFETRTPKTFAEDRESNYRLDVVEFCKTARLSQDQVDALAMCFLKTKFSLNTVQKIQENLPNPYKKQLTDKNIRFFLFKVMQSEAFMKQLYPNMKNLDEFKKHVTIEAQTKLPQDKKSNASNKSPNCVDQPRESLFSRTFSAAQSACYGMYQNKRPLAVASVAAAMPYLVQKSGVALPSQATMMLLPAAIFSGKLLTKREFPLIDTTTIVFDQGNSDKKQANIADHIVATGITHADTICATGAAVTGVAACNPHNSWQATAGLALTSGLFAFLGCKARQIHFRFNADWEINWKKNIHLETNRSNYFENIWAKICTQDVPATTFTKYSLSTSDNLPNKGSNNVNRDDNDWRNNIPALEEELKKGSQNLNIQSSISDNLKALQQYKKDDEEFRKKSRQQKLVTLYWRNY